MKSALLLLITALAMTPGAGGVSVTERKPNIVFIFADDWGWGDLSCHGHPWLQTPNLDRLASEGIDFQQFNVLNPVCSPSRAAAMTGMFPARLSIHQHFHFKVSENRRRGMPDWLDPTAPMLPRVLKKAGYRTGHFGKWHLSNDGIPDAPAPSAYGFDEFAVFNGPPPSVNRKETAANAVKFIQAHRGSPFYLNVWLHESHTPHIPGSETLAKWKHLDERERVYAAAISEGDAAVGLVLDALKSAGLANDTIVIFSSDNGPEVTLGEKAKSLEDGYGQWASVGRTGGLRGRKRSLHEGGVRVPFLVRWPGRAPAGTRNQATVFTAVDLLPTLCAAAGAALPEGYRGDGENLIDAFHGKEVRRKRPIFWEWRGPAGDPDHWPRLAVRDGDWKLVMDPAAGRLALYDLGKDRAEAEDLGSRHPDIVDRLSKSALEWQASLPTTPDPRCFSKTE